jgi:hypothetical protein
MKQLLLAMCVVLSAPLVASGAPITFDFAGTATVANGIWSGQGTAVTGSYTYDTDIVPSVANGSLNKFQSNIPGNAGFGWSITFEVGSVSRTVTENDKVFSFTVWDKARPGDVYSFGGSNASLSLAGSDPDAVVAPDGNAPLTAPDLSLFGSATGLYKIGGTPNQLSFRLTSITLGGGGGTGGSAPAPEPSAALLFGIGAVVVRSAVRRKPSA